MTAVAAAGAAVGLGLFTLLVGLFPPRPGIAARITAVDLSRGRVEPIGAARDGAQSREWRRQVGAHIAGLYAVRGWHLHSTRADLNLLGRSLDDHLAVKALLAGAGLLFGPLLFAVLSVAGIGAPLAVPVWVSLLGAALMFIAPDIDLRREAGHARLEFLRVLAAYLDWVKACLDGGRGVPEALPAAAGIGAGWALTRIRDALTAAQLAGRTPWAGLGQLGEDIGVDELKDLAATLHLVAADGAKIRASLAARAAGLRQRELTATEGAAAERTQGMLVAQLPLALGFLLFLLYPAVTRVLDIL